jgi:tetratricopeptide (TPR) repeat protein
MHAFAAPEPSDAADAALDRARHALRMQRPGEAERLAAAALRWAPDDALLAQALGHALLMQGRPAEAIDPLRRALQGSDDPALETLLARALGGAGRRDEAFDQLRRATARRPPFALAFLELGEQLGAVGRFDEAVDVLERGLELAPYATVLRIGLGRLHLERNERSKARSLFAQAHAAAPARHDALVALARVCALDGEFAAAADLYRRALELRPDDAVTRIDLAKCLMELGERDAGEAALRAATRGATRLAGLAITALAATSRGRCFLRPTAAAAFLRPEAG